MDNEENRFEHILYEIRMYFFSYVFVPSSQLELNMAIECRAIHIRNLACFFYKEKRDADEWHVSDFVTDTNGIRLIDDEKLFSKVKNYASRATGHLLRRHRLSHAYKIDTMSCYEDVFPLLLNAINDLLDKMDAIVKPERKPDWEDPRIQDAVTKVRTLMREAENPSRHFTIGAIGTSS